MIYEPVDANAPIRQGDVFVRVPRTEVSLDQIPLIGANYLQEMVSWDDFAHSPDPITAVLVLRPVIAIVVTQDCDAARAPDITLCEIKPFREVERKSADTSAPKKWVKIITQHARLNQKWFYLPPCARYGFSEKMGVDFLSTVCLGRPDLENYRRLRVCRLNPVALAHFRERIAEFFRRYPYDEWYPLDRDELAVYQSDYPDAKAFPWQEESCQKE